MIRGIFSDQTESHSEFESMESTDGETKSLTLLIFFIHSVSNIECGGEHKIVASLSMHTCHVWFFTELMQTQGKLTFIPHKSSPL